MQPTCPISNEYEGTIPEESVFNDDSVRIVWELPPQENFRGTEGFMLRWRLLSWLWIHKNQLSTSKFFNIIKQPEVPQSSGAQLTYYKLFLKGA